MSSSYIKINHAKIFTSWSYIIEKNADCTICRQNVNCDSIYAIEKGGSSKIMKGKCGHMFHQECIIPWLMENKKCPICSITFQ